MTILSQWDDLLARITREVAESYLRSRGWEQHDEERDVWIPSKVVGRKKMLVVCTGGTGKQELVFRLGFVEGRSALAVLADLIGVDAVRAAVDADLGPDPQAAAIEKRFAALRNHDLLSNAIVGVLEERSTFTGYDPNLVAQTKEIAALLGVENVGEWIDLREEESDDDGE